MEYMDYITRNIEICIWDFGFGPLAWALGTLGPKIGIWAPCIGPWDLWPIKTCEFSRPRDASKKHSAQILCKTAAVPRKIE